MKRELYINERLIELSESEPIALSYQVNDIAELADRQANYSNTFTVPDTNNNRIVLGFSNSTQSNSNVPYRKCPCVYIQEGIYIFQNGVAIIEQFDGSFQITMYSGIFDFFSQMGEKTLKDIDWSEFDHLYDSDTIAEINRQYVNDGSEVCWPLIQWGAWVKNLDFDLRYQNPAIKFSTIINKIVSTTTYLKGGQIFSDGIYNDMALILNPEKYGVDPDSLNARSYKGGLSLSQIVTDTGVAHRPRRLNIANVLAMFNNYDDGQTSDNVVLDTIHNAITPYPVSGVTPTPPNVTVYKADGYYSLQINFKINFKSIIVNGLELYRIYKNGKEINAVSIFEVAPGSTYTNLSFENTYNVDVEPGDYITINMYILNFTLFGSDGHDTNYISVAAIDSAPVFGNVSYNSIVPDYKLKDFIKSFCQTFALLISTNDGVVTFTKFSEIKENANISEDWSEKIDLSQTPIVSYRIGDYAQINNFKYADDETTNGFGDGLFSIDDTTLPKEKDLISMVYPSALIEEDIFFTDKKNQGVNIKKYTLFQEDTWTSSKAYSEGDNVNYAGQIYIAQQDNIGIVPGTDLSQWILKDYQYEATTSSPARVVLIRRISPTHEIHPGSRNWNLTYVDGVNTVDQNVYFSPMAYFADASMAYNLTFNYLISNYYQELQNMLSQLKVVSCLMRLSDADISKLNFLTLKYVQYFGNYFYLNKIEDYISGDSANVQLIRM